MKFKLFLICSLALMMMSAFSSHPKEEKSDSILGLWVYTDYDDDNGAWVYTKRMKFKHDSPGIKFKKNGILLKRQNLSFCGTPPISYTNVDGTWKQTSDSTISISYPSVISTIEEDYLILKHTKSTLTLKRLEYRALGNNMKKEEFKKVETVDQQ